MSSLLALIGWSPARIGAHHRVEDREQLAHARGQGERLGFAGARPPQTRRVPLSVPLSRTRGATPTSAAICLQERVPTSGKSPMRVPLTVGPTPGVVRSKFSLARQTGLDRIVWSRSWLTSWRRRSNQRMCWVMSRRMAGRA